MILFFDKTSNSQKSSKLLLRLALVVNNSWRAQPERVPHLMSESNFKEHAFDSPILLFTFISYSIRAVILSQISQIYSHFLKECLVTFGLEADRSHSSAMCPEF